MPSRQINDFSQKGNRKKLCELPDLGAPHHSEEQETDEVAVVEVANAVIDPRAERDNICKTNKCFSGESSSSRE